MTTPLSKGRTEPFLFEEFFEMGGDERLSPFLTPQSRHWAINLTLKGALLAAFLLFFSFVFSFFPTLQPLSHFLLIGVYVFAGVPALIESVEDLCAFTINIDVLMTLAAFGSIFMGSGIEGGLLLVLFALSGAMEDAVTSKAKSSLHTLHRLSPTRAWVIRADGTILEKALRDISVGMRILIKAGELIPLDGKVVRGASSIQMAHLTGESIPLPANVGDSVAAGARNMEGVLEVEVERTGSDSTLARMIRLVTQAQESRPRWQQWFDRWSQTYAMAIICMAGAFALLFPWLFSLPFFGTDGALYRALAFLIAASPCALIIATPIAYLSAVSICAREGILMKGGVVLDALAHCSAVAFDKTGTLTTGELSCTGIEALDKAVLWERKEILSLAAGLERNAVHPIAKAVLALAEEEGVVSAPIKDFQALPGTGVQGRAENGHALLHMGHPEALAALLPAEKKAALLQRVQAIQEQGEGSAVFLAGQRCFLFRFVDTLRPEVPQTLATLKNDHSLCLYMLTGDHFANAKRIAQQVPLDEIKADLRPEDKLYFIDSWARVRGLAMVGDGMNDAPALARATVGIAMGKGSSMTAVDAADIVLLHNHIGKLDWLFRKARSTKKIVRQNLLISAAAILGASLPAICGWVPLWLAVILHEGGTLLVGCNALRLLRKG